MLKIKTFLLRRKPHYSLLPEFCTLLLVLTGATAYSSSHGFFDAPPILALLKQDDIFLREEEHAADKKPEPEKTEQAVPQAWSPGVRFGAFFPGPSSDTGDFSTGPSAGGYIHFPLGAGILETTFDITCLKAPSDVDKDSQLLFMTGVNYLFRLDRFYIGGGATFSNASPINELFLFQAAAGITVHERFDITLYIYIPAGNPNNSYMAALYAGYRF